MSQCNDYWDPVRNALFAILDVLPAEQQEKAVQQLQAMARVCEDRGDIASSYFCRELSGEKYPEPKAGPKLSVVKDV